MSDLDQELARLGAGTDGVRARAGFEARVLGAVAREALTGAPAWFRAARLVLPGAALLAAVSVGFAVDAWDAGERQIAENYAVEAFE